METPPRQGLSFGPSKLMLVGCLLSHPFVYLALAGALFTHSAGFRKFLWEFQFDPWRRCLLEAWNYCGDRPWLWLIPLGLALAHVVIRFCTTRYSMSEDYLFVQTGFLSFRSPVGPFRLYNDPIAFSTVTDANMDRSLLQMLSGTGTILLKSSEIGGKVIRLPWVRKANEVQALITQRAGVRKARMLSTVR